MKDYFNIDKEKERYEAKPLKQCTLEEIEHHIHYHFNKYWYYEAAEAGTGQYNARAASYHRNKYYECLDALKVEGFSWSPDTQTVTPLQSACC